MTPYYQSGGITIYNCDCREVIPTLADVDLILTDPPYGIDYGRAGGFSASHGWGAWRENVSWDKERPPDEIFAALLGLKLNTIIWGGNYFTDLLPPRMGWMIWNKLQRDFSLADAEMAWTSAQRATRVFDYSWAAAMQDKKIHPTQKPEALMRWCINSFPETKSVFDPFLGSGTTLRAAKDLGLVAVGCELEEKYCEGAARRMEQSVLDFGAPRPAFPGSFVSPIQLDLPMAKAERFNPFA